MVSAQWSTLTIVGGGRLPFGSGFRPLPFLRSTPMKRETRATSGAGRLPAAVGVLAAGAAAVAWLSPGGLGRAGAVQVTDGVSVSGYRAVIGAAAGTPSWVGPALEWATEGTPVLLGVLLVAMWWTAMRRRDGRGVAKTVLTGIGTVAAYAVSEAMKVVVDEERPCRALRTGIEVIADCPAGGDWSFPSNHATLAAGLAVGPAVLWPRLAVLTLPLAGAAALLRVLVGVHYPHDVLAGASLGGAVVAAALLGLMPPTQRVVSSLLSRWWQSDARFVGDHRGRGPVLHAQPGQDGGDVRLDSSFDHVQAPGYLPVGHR
ncbi:hypothetical protein Ade02nite_85370 [Paractinoplanes deccanensis]|uniref:Phosphatidic acid phosphatase type 2/haloperoxidase domain-containing protein n=1 Tax=Paractinoplanes deccanensis TaxID=113561 RepID=A0ABQ3YIR6_9ACTN|nr:hypothetical protein Ade02nite_85370 [Actinoplanes deccanensis]